MRNRLLGMLLPLALGHIVFLPRGYAEDPPAVEVAPAPAPVMNANPALPVPVLNPNPAYPAPVLNPAYQSVNYPPSPIRDRVLAPSYFPEAPEPGHGVSDWLRRHRLVCWTHHDSPGCGSLRSDGVYIFGSCRKWYGEPCLPRPDPYPPVPQGYAEPSRKGCACSW